MKKWKIFLIALTTVSAFTLVACGEEAFAMGPNGGVIQPQGEKEQGEKGREYRKDGESSPGKEKENGKTEKSSPQKKPRLKYRDPFDCSC